jgi:hypothetical protein
VRSEADAGGNNLGSSFSTLTTKAAKQREPDKMFVVDTECESEREHGLFY